MQTIRRSQKGYTLVEVLTALFIFVIVMAIVSYSLIQVINNVNILKKTEKRLAQIQMMLSIVTFDLSQIINKETEQKASFYTETNKLHFIKTGNINPHYQYNRSSLEEIEYRLENSKMIKASKEVDKNSFKPQILLEEVVSLKWVFIDDKFKEYTLWPPTQDWRFEKPIAIKLIIELSDIGLIEKIVDTGHHG